jgi:hypothetical protein
VLIGQYLPEQHPNQRAAENDREDSEADKDVLHPLLRPAATVPDWPRPALDSVECYILLCTPMG